MNDNDTTKTDEPRAPLSGSERAFRNIVDSSPLGMHLYELGDDGALVFVGANPAADQILGVDNSIFVGKTIEEAFPPLAKTEVPQRYREAARDGTVWETEQIEYDEGQIKGAFQVVAFQTEPGKMAVQFHDITPRKQLEARLRLFEEAVDGSTHAIGMSTPGGKHFYQNKAFSELFGDIGDDPPGSVYVEEDVGREVFNVIMAGGKWEGEVQMYSRTREIVDVFLRAYASKDEKGEIVLLVGTHIDITQRKKYQEMAKNTQKLEALGMLAGGIAHDFNNLLGGLFGYVNLAMMESSDSAKGRGYLEKAMMAMERAKGLTHQLLTFATGGKPVTKVRSIGPVVESATKFALSGSNVSCSFSLGDEPWYCEIDENQITQVIDNIVINAQQAMPKGGRMEISAREVEVEPNQGFVVGGNHVELSFRDHGTGIPKSILDNIFDPFFTTKSKGHGLGLSTSHSIVNNHGGSIRAESVVGEGTIVFVTIPLSAPNASTVPSNDGSRHQGSGRVLIMDDEDIILDVFRDMLRSLGYEVVTTSRGEETIDVFKKELDDGRRFKAMIFDLTIQGGMGGLDTLEQVRKLDQEIPVFVVSGYAQENVLADPEKYGFTDSLSKPLKLAQLSAMLNRHL